jgi:hypothetical protein
MKFKIGIITVIACALALVLFFQGGRANPVGGGADTRTQWLCKSCTHNFLLTAKEVAQRADPDPRHWAPLVCPECKQKQAYQALVCPKCKTIYFGSDVPGETGQCPKCSKGRRLSVAESNRPANESARVNASAAKTKPAAKVR